VKCIDIVGGIFKNKLYELCHLNNKSVLETVCNISFLSTILELYSEISLSQKTFGMGHMYTFLLRMTDTVTSQNIDLSSWDTLDIHKTMALSEH
jgi:hypothetical protein